MDNNLFPTQLKCGGILDLHFEHQEVHCLNGFHYSLGTCFKKFSAYCVFGKTEAKSSVCLVVPYAKAS